MPGRRGYLTSPQVPPAIVSPWDGNLPESNWIYLDSAETVDELWYKCEDSAEFGEEYPDYSRSGDKEEDLGGFVERVTDVVAHLHGFLSNNNRFKPISLNH